MIYSFPKPKPTPIKTSFLILQGQLPLHEIFIYFHIEFTEIKTDPVIKIIIDSDKVHLFLDFFQKIMITNPVRGKRYDLIQNVIFAIRFIVRAVLRYSYLRVGARSSYRAISCFMRAD